MSLAARRRLDAAQFKVLDAREIDEPSNSDEALALFAAYAEPGDRLTIHDPECPTREDGNQDCGCAPVVITVGATA